MSLRFITRLTLLMMLGLSFIGRPLLGQQSERPEQSAFSEIEAAQLAYMEGRFEDAINALEPLLPTLVDDKALRDAYFFLGLNYLALRNDMEASNHFRSAVHQDPTFVPSREWYSPDVVSAYEGIRADLVGELIVESVPQGATVLVGGRTAGLSPYRGVVLAGEHLVKVEMEGYVGQERRVTVLADDETSVSVTMRSIIASVSDEVEEQRVVGAALPTGKKKSIKPSLALFGVSGGTLAWFLAESGNAQGLYNNYLAAGEAAESSDLRKETEAARSRRNTAAYVTIGSTGVLAIFLIRYILSRRTGEAHSLEQNFRHGNVQYRLKLDLNPELASQEVGLNVHMLF